MSILEVVLTVAVVYLAGAVVILGIDSDLKKDELLALAGWPLVLPVVVAIRTYRRWAYTCRDCGGNYGDRERYSRHLVHRTYCTVPAAETASV